MLASITPVGESGRGQRWGITAVSHVVGAALGGALLGGTLGALGSLVQVAWPGPGLDPTTSLFAAAAVVAVAAVLERGPLAVRVPSLHRQVDERWLDTYRGWVYGAGYGMQLGLGLVTIVPTWATPAMLLAMLLAGSPSSGAFIGVVYGIARGTPVLVTAGLRTPARLWSFHERLEGLDPVAGRVTVAVLLVSALGAFTFAGAGVS